MACYRSIQLIKIRQNKWAQVSCRVSHLFKRFFLFRWIKFPPSCRFAWQVRSPLFWTSYMYELYRKHHTECYCTLWRLLYYIKWNFRQWIWLNLVHGPELFSLPLFSHETWFPRWELPDQVVDLIKQSMVTGYSHMPATVRIDDRLTCIQDLTWNLETMEKFTL